MLSTRERARLRIEAALARGRSGPVLPSKLDAKDAGLDAERASSHAMEGLSAEDRALLNELTQGTLREWRFLEWVVARYAKRRPKGALRTILWLSAYQLLFLERVPDYAVYSEAGAMARAIGASDSEIAFAHAILKKIQGDRLEISETRASALDEAARGAPAAKESVLAALNASAGLLDALTLVVGVRKAEARGRAYRALAAMKARPPLVGYALPGAAPEGPFRPLESTLAPRALKLQPGDELERALASGRIRVQGEASQWACEVAAERLDAIERVHDVTAMKVLEMAAGKGGKLLGTLAALTARCGGDPAKCPPIDWVAADASEAQMKILETDTLPLVRSIWPQVHVQTLRTDWRGSDTPKGGKFDFVWVDAPCTGFGTLAKHPEIALHRGDAAYEEALKLAEVQGALCDSAGRLLASDGALFYSVCTLTHPETYGIVERCRARLGRAPSVLQSLWPGSPPAPTAEGFFLAFF